MAAAAAREDLADTSSKLRLAFSDLHAVDHQVKDDTPESHPWDWARELRKKRPGRLSDSLEDNHWSQLENKLWSQMDEWRKVQGDSFDILYIMILPEDEMRDIVRVVPTTMDELKTIGIWRATDRHEIHGDSLLAVINGFLQSNNVTLKGEFPRENEVARFDSPAGTVRSVVQEGHDDPVRSP
ncbi:unnamed protein product [Scytosiphon promiscuus]